MPAYVIKILRELRLRPVLILQYMLVTVSYTAPPFLTRRQRGVEILLFLLKTFEGTYYILAC